MYCKQDYKGLFYNTSHVNYVLIISLLLFHVEAKPGIAIIVLILFIMMMMMMNNKKYQSLLFMIWFLFENKTFRPSVVIAMKWARVPSGQYQTLTCRT